MPVCPTPAERRYRLDDLNLDIGRRQVSRRGRVLELGKLTFDLLQALVEAAPAVVTKDELTDRVWPGRIVSPETVAQRVKLLREALGDAAQAPRYIEVVRGQGYRLIPEVEPLPAEVERPSRRHYMRWIAAALVGLAAIPLMLLLSTNRMDEHALPTSIAVLPFANLSTDADQEYLADGLTVELASLLSRMPELRVSANTSSFSFKGSELTIAEIAATLNVTHILEGSVRRAGSEIRVTAQLIKASDGFNVWSNTYNRRIENVFALQDEIAASIIRAVGPTLAGRKPEVPTTDSQAYALYLKGRYLDNLKGQDNWQRAVRAYRQALEIDPEYAPAWAGLSLTYYYQTTNRVLAYESGMKMTRDTAERALALDDRQADALATLGLVRSSYDWDWPGALDAIQRALSLEPGNSNVLNRAGSLAFALGRIDESVELYRRAIVVDPLNMSPQNALAIAYMYSGRLEEGKATLKSLMALNPDYPWARINLARIHLLEGEPAMALDVVAASEPNVWRDYIVTMANHSLHRDSTGEAMMAGFIERHGDSSPVIAAEIEAWRGRTDEAFQHLQKAYGSRDPGLIYIGTSPFFANFRKDSRWPLLLDRIGLLDPPDLALTDRDIVN